MEDVYFMNVRIELIGSRAGCISEIGFSPEFEFERFFGSDHFKPDEAASNVIRDRPPLFPSMDETIMSNWYIKLGVQTVARHPPPIHEIWSCRFSEQNVCSSVYLFFSLLF